jgi:hypothetical protein
VSNPNWFRTQQRRENQRRWVGFPVSYFGVPRGKCQPGDRLFLWRLSISPHYLLEENFTSEIRIGHVSFTPVSNLLKAKVK